MKKIIYDCDNTMGVEFRDVDDALTLLYLIGREDVNLLGVTTTFGNDSVDVVYETTVNLLRDIGNDSLEVYKGGTKDARESKAAEFMAKTAAENKGEVTLLATGSLANLYGAYQKDNNFFSNLKEVVVMGGITEPLIINGVNCNELNFSSDPEATYHVLSSGVRVTVMTGHLCLNAMIGDAEFQYMEEKNHLPLYNYLLKRLIPWRDFMKKIFKIDGFYNWDVVAGIYTTNPELYSENIVSIYSGTEDFQTGMLKRKGFNVEGYDVNMPTVILDIDRFNAVLFEAWENVKM